MVNIYRRYIPNCAQMIALITDLTRSRAAEIVKWGDSHADSALSFTLASDGTAATASKVVLHMVTADFASYIEPRCITVIFMPVGLLLELFLQYSLILFVFTNVHSVYILENIIKIQ